MVRASLAVVAVALVLCGCTPSAPPSSSTERPSASIAPPASPSPTPIAAADDFLLRITATATVPDGSSVHLIETVTGPSPSDGSETAKMTAAQCDDTRWRTDIPNPSWLRLDLSASWITGSALVDESIPVFGSGGEGWVAWSGNVDPYQAYCTAVIVGINGHATAVATAVAPVDTSDAPGAGRSWSAGLYGFSQLYERETPTSPPLTYTECRLELGPGATSQAALLPRVPAVAGFGQDCLFGKHPS